MSKTINNFNFHCNTDVSPAGILSLFKLGEIMTQVSELATKLEAINAQLTKASAEISAKVVTLTEEISSLGALSPAAEDALTSLSTIAKNFDDMNDDAVTDPVV